MLHYLKYMLILRINPNLMMDLLRTIIKKILRRVRKSADATRNPRIMFPTRVRTFPNTGVTNLCAKSAVVTVILQRNLVPRVILLIFIYSLWDVDVLLKDISMKPTSTIDLTPLGKRLVVRNKFLRNQAATPYQEARILL